MQTATFKQSYIKYILAQSWISNHFLMLPTHPRNTSIYLKG